MVNLPGDCETTRSSLVASYRPSLAAVLEGTSCAAAADGTSARSTYTTERNEKKHTHIHGKKHKKRQEKMVGFTATRTVNIGKGTS